MRHAHHDLFHAEIAAALDDLLQPRDQRLGAVEAEALGAGELHIGEFFEAIGFDELLQDRALAFRRKADLLVGTFDALLDPRLLLRIGDVHELDAERLAVGALADRDDLAQRGEVEAEHVIEEYLAVEIGVGEAVGTRIELFVVLRRLDSERIEIGVEVAAHAVSADQHQRANRIARRLLNVGCGQLGALGLRLRRELRADRLLDLRPVAVERGDEIVARRDRPVRLLPGRPFGAALNVGRLILQALEELLPLAVDRGRVLLEPGVHLFDEGSIGTVEEGRKGESGIRILTRHAAS